MSLQLLKFIFNPINKGTLSLVYCGLCYTVGCYGECNGRVFRGVVKDPSKDLVSVLHFFVGFSFQGFL